MQEVRPLVSDFQVLPRNLNSGFFPVLATFDSFAVNPLQSCQFLFSVNIESWIDNRLAFVVSQECLKTNINANLSSGWVLDFWNVNITGKDSKPLPCLVTLDGHSLDLSLRYPMENDWQRTNLGHLQPFVAEKFEPALWIGDRLDFGFEARKPCFDFYAFLPHLESVEEIVKRFVQPVRDILQYLGVNISNFWRTYLDVQQKRIEIIFVGCVEFLALVKQSIICFLTKFELIEKSDLLFPRGIQPILIHPAELHRQEVRLCYL